MAKGTSSKKVTRVARTGGGRTKRGGQSRSLLFPGVIGMTVVLGIFLIWFSKDQRAPDTSAPQPGDHWHSALGVNICGEFAPDIPDSGRDPLGIHTHGDGVVHTHPFTSLGGGSRATLARFFDAVDVDISATKIEVPGADVKENGDLCDGRPGVVQAKVWDSRSPSDPGRVVTGDPGDIRLGDNQLITLAFLPEGAEIPKPPTEGQLDRLTDVPGAPTTTSELQSTTTVAGSTTSSVTPTTAPAVTTTAAP